jgi:BolA-like protein 1
LWLLLLCCSESHFKVFVVSEKFEGMSVLARHRAVNDAVRNKDTGELPVHALSIQAKTPAQ